jgi:hypothetical protein
VGIPVAEPSASGPALSPPDRPLAPHPPRPASTNATSRVPGRAVSTRPVHQTEPLQADGRGSNSDWHLGQRWLIARLDQSFEQQDPSIVLAAVLWSGGISFAGVMAFIFADLIVLPNRHPPQVLRHQGARDKSAERSA